MRVYDLEGALVSRPIDPVSSDAGEGRISDGDVAYGLKVARRRPDRRGRGDRSRPGRVARVSSHSIRAPPCR